MNADLIRIAVIGAVALALYYVVSQNLAISNEGEVNVSPEEASVPESFQQPLPKYNPPAGDDPARGQPQIDNSLSPPRPGETRRPETYAYDFVPGRDPPRAAQLNVVKQNTNVLPYPQVSNNYGPSNGNVSGQFNIKTGSQPTLDCFPKDTVTPQELMPREDPYNTWSQVNPTVSGHLADRNFLESAWSYGVNTQGSSLRNANLQLRSDPVISQIQVGPWSQSTISPDTNRRQLEIGGDY